MIIQEMSEYDIRDMIQHTHVGRLACIHEGRPYVVPLSFRFSGGSLYSFTTIGQKTDGMRKNDAVCILFDDIVSPTQWRSVVVNGRYREIIREEEQNAIVNMMANQPVWWEPAYTKSVTRSGEQRKLTPVFFRVDIESATGHETN
ncbi:pyridoxamine 5'-phosphate oxidase family protein [Falsochrobactrum shanghaiense]|uniref:Pyridoxamine 5'-phosphate oxidase family protein n=1 Tax=Falsochrobactrum shanghaiense TaxID=2201899 RepID=A0A316J873_9HYPH|nr:pyridoxamine 5'-phosphate oxidase family protein [Falsochrobactrum shanghaiense]PWL16955.1 pyridoxamine 5'-phosphate oxidase family protein [Falsochrobactrum shanghaiense]